MPCIWGRNPSRYHIKELEIQYDLGDFSATAIFDRGYHELAGFGVKGGMMVEKKGSGINQEGFTISIFFSISFILFVLNKDM